MKTLLAIYRVIVGIILTLLFLVGAYGVLAATYNAPTFWSGLFNLVGGFLALAIVMSILGAITGVADD